MWTKIFSNQTKPAIQIVLLNTWICLATFYFRVFLNVTILFEMINCCCTFYIGWQCGSILRCTVVWRECPSRRSSDSHKSKYCLLNPLVIHFCSGILLASVRSFQHKPTPPSYEAVPKEMMLTSKKLVLKLIVWVVKKFWWLSGN